MAESAATLERLELRVKRLQLTFRFTYAFHAREIRFECDRGEGFVRIFPETFSFHADRHDPAELSIQLDDLSRKPGLLSPEARRRDVQLLIARLVIAVPRYLERVLNRLEEGGRIQESALARVYEDVTLLAQVFMRFAGDPESEERPGVRLAILHLRKLSFRALQRLVERRVEAHYLAGYVAGSVDPVDPADDLSEAGFFHTMASGEQSAVNRSLVRLAERAFYRWLEDVCLDEENGAFEGEDSPFDSREIEVRRAISADDRLLVERGRDLTPFLRRTGNKDCLRVLGRLEDWFLRQYDIHHAAVVIYHADHVAHGTSDADRVLSRHRTRNYVLALLGLATPFLAASVAYERAPFLFDLLCAVELGFANVALFWFLFYRFLWKRNLTFFRAAVPRIAAGIIVGYLPIFFIDEVWSLAGRSSILLAGTVVILGTTTFLYLYVEVQRRLGDTTVAFQRARQIFLLGVLQAFGIGLILTGLVGRFMVLRNWARDAAPAGMDGLRASLDPFLGQLPQIVGLEPLYTFPAAIFVMTFMSFFIGTFLQLMWEDIPLTQPL